MSQAATIRDTLSPRLVAQVLSQQLCDAEGEDICRLVLAAGIELIRQRCSAAELRWFLSELSAQLHEALNTATDPVMAANAGLAVVLLDAQMWNVNTPPRLI